MRRSACAVDRQCRARRRRLPSSRRSMARCSASLSAFCRGSLPSAVAARFAVLVPARLATSIAIALVAAPARTPNSSTLVQVLSSSERLRSAFVPQCLNSWRVRPFPDLHSVALARRAEGECVEAVRSASSALRMDACGRRTFRGANRVITAALQRNSEVLPANVVLRDDASTLASVRNQASRSTPTRLALGTILESLAPVAQRIEPECRRSSTAAADGYPGWRPRAAVNSRGAVKGDGVGSLKSCKAIEGGPTP
jgi:hypothetical protein